MASRKVLFVEGIKKLERGMPLSTAESAAVLRYIEKLEDDVEDWREQAALWHERYIRRRAR